MTIPCYVAIVNGEELTRSTDFVKVGSALLEAMSGDTVQLPIGVMACLRTFHAKDVFGRLTCLERACDDLSLRDVADELLRG